MIDPKNIVTKELKTTPKGVMKYCPKCNFNREVSYSARCPEHNVLLLEKEEAEVQRENLSDSLQGIVEDSKSHFNFKKRNK